MQFLKIEQQLDIVYSVGTKIYCNIDIAEIGVKKMKQKFERDIHLLWREMKNIEKLIKVCQLSIEHNLELAKENDALRDGIDRLKILTMTTIIIMLILIITM